MKRRPSVLSISAFSVSKRMVRFVCVQKLYVPNGRTAEAGSAQAREGRTAARRPHTPLADFLTLAKNNVSLGDSGSLAEVTVPASGQKMTFKLQGIFPSEMFPASAGQASVNCLPVNRKLWICDVKFSLNAVCTTCDWRQL